MCPNTQRLRSAGSADTYAQWCSTEYSLLYLKNSKEPLPFLLTRTPYGVSETDSPDRITYVKDMAHDGYIFLGDDFHHNGAFRLSYGFEYAFMEEATKTDSLFPFPGYDTYDWYLKLGALSNVNKLYFNEKLPTWNDFTKHPDYDKFWQKQSLTSRNDSPKIPIMNVADWWDQEDFCGPLEACQLWEKQDKLHKNFLVAGPWNHGGC